MTIMKRLRQSIPFIILFLLLSLLGRELYSATPSRELSSGITGDPLPNFQLPSLYAPNKILTNKQIKGHVAIINVWASWCAACKAEHSMLIKISSQYHVPMYGIIYKDDAREAMHWLSRKGNPFVAVGNDVTGDVSTDLGIYGTPETFVINPQGRIIYRHLGVITQSLWDEEIYPLVQPYLKSNV